MTDHPADLTAAVIETVADAAAHVPAEKRTLLKVAAKRQRDVAEFLQHGTDGHNLDPDFVHDLRVSVRRLSEVAGLLQVLMEDTTAQAISESLKALRRAAGELRDLDVTREHLAKWRMPAPLKKIAVELAEHLAQRRPDLENSRRTHLSAASVTGTMVLLSQLLEQHAAPHNRDAAEIKLHTELTSLRKKRLKQLRRDFGTAALKQSPAKLHEARIAAKKLRYIVELEDAIEIPGRKKELKFLKRIQQLLGDHHDVHVILETLEKHLKDPHDPPLKNLAPAWRKFNRTAEHTQSQRAAQFFMLSYQWLNK